MNTGDVWSSPGAFGHIEPFPKIPGETRAEREHQGSGYYPAFTGVIRTKRNALERENSLSQLSQDLQYSSFPREWTVEPREPANR